MSAVVARLRQATASAHADLERRVHLVAQVACPVGRSMLVGRFHALHEAAERALQPWLAAVDGLDFCGRSRLPHLRRDLAELGAAPVQSAARPQLASRVEALGAFYVLEGSTLGGHVIRRQLGDLRGLSFLDPYGARTGERWREVMAVLEREGAAPGTAEAMAAAAVATFGWAGEVLAPRAQAA